MWAPLHMRKIFVGGIDYTTTDESLREHFSSWGDVVDAVVMKDMTNNRSRGFGFVTFGSPEHVDAVQKARPHKVDGRLVETKRAVPRGETNNSVLPTSSHPDPTHTRIFIGGLPQDVKEEDLENYFANFGRVTCINIMYDKNSGRHRGFAFVDFNDYDPVDKVLLTRNHSIKGRLIDVKKAISKSDISKIKSIMTGAMAGPEAAFLASFGGGGGSNDGTPASTPIPPPLGALPPVAGTSGGASMNGSAGGRPAAPGTGTGTSSGGGASPGGTLPLPPMAHHFFPRLPLAGLPGFSAQLRSGWQYSLSGNAEVLRNTAGAISTRPSGAPAIAPAAAAAAAMTQANASALLAGGSEEEEEEEEEEEQVMDMEEGGSEAWEGTRGEDSCPPSARVLFIEPFYGGSHRQLIATLRSDESVIGPEEAALFTLPSKKWHWRARTAALYFYQKIPISHVFKVMFASSTLNLCELIGLRPDLAPVKKILYFHENQLVYPVKKQKDRDFQYGYNQILSCLVADVVVFNSQYNLESFLREMPRHLKLQPDHRPDTHSLVEAVRAKSRVLFFPVNISHKTRSPKDALEPLHIIWPHRWEHDKDPTTMFKVLFQLAEAGLNFRVCVLGQSFSENPPIFNEARQRLANFITHWGYAESREKYWELLHTGDVVVSTAHHEFFGVAMLEAVGAGCFPICPNRLVYPEIFPQECLYNTTQQLQKSLAQWCARPQLVRSKKVNLDLNTFSWATLKQQYRDLLT
ncbi:hypothetical protein O3P69_018865 [Scylla paramamosain]|uniref:tRNA-queuosine alpha-mannosyltransferase n=1 Tax=Scylla paramamosain TaxID=85552 RepID=A0AAW0SS01_SCYPA